MKHYPVETQYRVVGACSDGSFILTWHDTVRAAMEHAMRFPAAVIVRPDGSRIEYRSAAQEVA